MGYCLRGDGLLALEWYLLRYWRTVLKDHADSHGVMVGLIERGKPVQDIFVESLSARPRNG
jgi:hypothetical protein